MAMSLVVQDKLSSGAMLVYTLDNVLLASSFEAFHLKRGLYTIAGFELRKVEGIRMGL